MGQRADEHEHIARAPFVFRVGVAARRVNDLGCEMILGHDLHRHETLSGVGQGDRDRRRLQVEDPGGIDRVAVHPHNILLVDRRRLTAVDEPCRRRPASHISQSRHRSRRE